MKHLFKTKKTKAFLTISFCSLLLSVGLSSCKKDDTNTDSVAMVMAVNAASSSTVAQDFYVNNEKANTSPLLYSQNSAYVSVTNANAVQFRSAGTSTVNASSAVYFANGLKYTVFYTDDKSVVYGPNDPNGPSAGKAKVRFLNLSQALDAKADIAISGNSKIVTDLAYKTGSSYAEVNPATSFSLSLAGSTSVLLNLPTTIAAGKNYTVYFTGTTIATINYQVIEEN